MVDIAQLVERWIVVPQVMGSYPIIHPSYTFLAELVDALD